MIRTVMNIQSAYAKALLVDRGVLARAQAEGDVPYRWVIERLELALGRKLRARLWSGHQTVAGSDGNGTIGQGV